MMRKDFVAKRNEVCAGRLIYIDPVNIIQYDGKGNEIVDQSISDNHMNINTNNFSAYSGKQCRGMLFTADGEWQAHDLIYTTPTNYQIVLPNKQEIPEDGFIIDHYVEMEELLKYLKYGEDLTQKDLWRIYKMFVVSSGWIERHRELFGWINLGNFGYGTGGQQTISREIYNQLSTISSSGNGKPNEIEPYYEEIKRIRRQRPAA